jgi:hypothetical protein
MFRNTFLIVDAKVWQELSGLASFGANQLLFA